MQSINKDRTKLQILNLCLGGDHLSLLCSFPRRLLQFHQGTVWKTVLFAVVRVYGCILVKKDTNAFCYCFAFN